MHRTSRIRPQATAPRALCRHVPRALEAGATPEQVLDAISLTLPVSGLTRTSVAEQLELADGGVRVLTPGNPEQRS